MNIIGRLTRDADIRTLSNEKQVVNFSVAVNDSYKNRQGERVQQTTYFDCAYWLNTKVANYLTKGTLVELLGRVSAKAWQGNDGQPKATLNFQTSKIILHSVSRTEGSVGTRAETLQAAVQQESNGLTTQGTDDDLPF